MLFKRPRCKVWEKREKVKKKNESKYDPEVLERLPFWVKELLAMIKENKDVKRDRAPSASS